ncbi:MAG: lytic transglycosylase domain-containing protein [Veillonellaceae bacterium]|uniref:lytic transglycosylase domain-containing protein n=1 Tax=Anaerovibrio lipolyticus TaxID=82374 RepID=UPI001F3DD410|nr:lytic transglycosylase domain-containing protein [Anaerovibrio lipolyticus]MCI6910829.1 lytic transglycosylase domain-containing protein [Veillonellaceae bacterium]MDY4485024.1 lytic transglycosylase domain-containing protein [Anaerovibrio sp.]MCF2600371.1 lytic transglycosylase domain-containing protein [Anaerovibrio lipolyticus]MCI7090958.1 lytic transglycosylase domain-containing protein [Veillonellaceae bacterium]MCI7234646.1 lytic transglycosylase domain-containing protein [Veillonella
MMQIEGLNSIIHRIDELNMRFGINTAANYQENVNKTAATGGVEQEKPQRLENGSFATELDKAMSMESRGAVGLNISGDTNSLIKEAAARYQVDPRLVAAVAQTESGGNQEAVSPAGAVGVMQLMPETAAGLGVNPYDKRQNIEGGAKYLRQMMDTFGGDVQKAVAAYNAGPQAVKEYNGIPPYRETQDYVNKVLDIYR